MLKLILVVLVSISQVVYGGISAGEYSKMAIMGDAGLTGPDLEKLQDSIAREQITSLVLPGDNLYFGRYDWTWDNWKKMGFKFDVVAIGNHNGGYEKEIGYFNMPGEYYSVVKNRARFLVLNSDNQENVDRQISWVRNELADAKEKLIFLVFHHPSFNTGGGHDWHGKEIFQKQMHQIYRDFGKKISAVIVGHEHISTFVTFDSLPVIVAGSGREVKKSSAVSYEDEGMKIQTLFLAPRQQHWADLEISANGTEAWVHFIRVSDQNRTCSAYLKDGTISLAQNCKGL
jgi:predicted phosphodiesterase